MAKKEEATPLMHTALTERRRIQAVAKQRQTPTACIGGAATAGPLVGPFRTDVCIHPSVRPHHFHHP